MARNELLSGQCAHCFVSVEIAFLLTDAIDTILFLIFYSDINVGATATIFEIA